MSFETVERWSDILDALRAGHAKLDRLLADTAGHVTTLAVASEKQEADIDKLRTQVETLIDVFCRPRDRACAKCGHTVAEAGRHE